MGGDMGGESMHDPFAITGFVFGLIGMVVGLVALALGVVALVFAVRAHRAVTAGQRRLAALRTTLDRPSLGAGEEGQREWLTYNAADLAAGRQELPLDQTRELRRLRDTGQPILATKRARELTGLGLADAKRFVDQL